MSCAWGWPRRPSSWTFALFLFFLLLLILLLLPLLPRIPLLFFACLLIFLAFRLHTRLDTVKGSYDKLHSDLARDPDLLTVCCNVDLKKL